MTRMLEGIRILDLSRVLAGPWATQLMADLGATVIKVERPLEGDDTRRWGPPWLYAGGEATSAYYLCANRGKEAIAVDFTDAEGQQIIRDLAAGCDVVVENFKVGTLKRYGLDAARLREANPALVYCSVTGFGQDGPYSGRPGYDFIAQGMGGLMSVTGSQESGPMKTGVALSDIMTGLYSAIAILAALVRRGNTGDGAVCGCDYCHRCHPRKSSLQLFRHGGESAPVWQRSPQHRAIPVFPDSRPRDQSRNRERLSVSSAVRRNWAE